MEYTEYQTKQNQRWDTIAWECYGDPYGYEPIVAANPQWRDFVVLPANVRLIVPVRSIVQRSLGASLLPPWRRNA